MKIASPAAREPKGDSVDISARVLAPRLRATQGSHQQKVRGAPLQADNGTTACTTGTGTVPTAACCGQEADDCRKDKEPAPSQGGEQGVPGASDQEAPPAVGFWLVAFWGGFRAKGAAVQMESPLDITLEISVSS